MARESVSLHVRQQPTRAQVVQENNPKNRKPIDPPPIIELKYEDNNPQNEQWLVSPRTFMMVTLIDEKNGNETVSGKHLIGQTVSSLHRLKDITNKGKTWLAPNGLRWSASRQVSVVGISSVRADVLHRWRILCFWRHLSTQIGHLQVTLQPVRHRQVS